MRATVAARTNSAGLRMARSGRLPDPAGCAGCAGCADCAGCAGWAGGAGSLEGIERSK
jgi:hypothetical protein